MRVHDIPLDLIATSQEVIATSSPFPRPKGIYWELLEEEKIASIPILKRLASHR